MPKLEFDADDPMEMIGVAIEGDFDAMASGLVDEFILMGFDEEAIWSLFSNPFYRSTHAILQTQGEKYVRDLIKNRLMTWV